MNPTRPFPCLWDCETKNRKRRDMLDAATLEINFEIKRQYVHETLEKTLQAALGLKALRLVEASSTNTRWVAVQDADMFMRRLPAWEMLMLLYSEDAIDIGWEDTRTKELDGVLFAQARYAYDWGVFNPKFFVRFGE
jgi:hypothetical protein